MQSKLLTKLRRYDTLEQAWRVVQNNARTSTSREIRQEVNDFAQAAGPKLRSICNRLSRGKFVFVPAKGILSAKKDEFGRKTGKFRPIVLAPLETRIVQRAFLEVLNGIPSLESMLVTKFSFGGIRKSRVDERSSGVPAAIDAVLQAIADGCGFYACADIKAFFTRIPRIDVLQTIGRAVDDTEFMALLAQAVSTELENMIEMRSHADIFPIEEIGVAQGSSLSPLLGNITLAKFDLEMNQGAHRCVRYIDDFIILEKSSRAANAQLRKAKRLLKELNMELSPEKSSIGAQKVTDGLSFLGVEVVPGYIRPTRKVQQRILDAIDKEYERVARDHSAFSKGRPLPEKSSLLATLNRVSSMVDAWGKAYWFCNDIGVFNRIDQHVKNETRAFLGNYRAVLSKLSDDQKLRILGVSRVSDQLRRPFKYPKSTAPSSP